jgi:hypothetical protein
VIGTILRDHLDLLDQPSLRLRLRHYQRAALLDIAACGTEACGLHRERCDHCGDQRMVANTCGNRSCPHCQAGDRRAWVAAREAELLPCGYFHVVMTLPSELRELAQTFPVVVLGALMQAAPDAVHHLARQPEHLDAEVGSIAILHTWGRDVKYHAHVHLITTGGGWQADTQQWVEACPQGEERRPYLLPVEALRKAYQFRFRRLLVNAYDAGEFHSGDWEAFPMLASAPVLRAFLDELITKAWCVHIEPPFGSPQVLLRYLGRYINRVAVSPERVSYDPNADTVTIAWKDHDTCSDQSLVLGSEAFIERFARHILPPGFVRIRFRGLWATAHRATKLDVVRRALEQARPNVTSLEKPPDATPPAPTVNERFRCTVCDVGTYHRLPGGNRPNRAERHRRLRVMGPAALISHGEAHLSA